MTMLEFRPEAGKYQFQFVRMCSTNSAKIAQSDRRDVTAFAIAILSSSSYSTQSPLACTAVLV